MATEKNINVKVIVLESLSIVVAVLLALGMDEWRENYEHSQQSEAAIRKVANELDSNLDLLKLLHENNVATIEAMANVQEQKEQRSFVPGSQLSGTAWETLSATGVANYVDFETILELSGTYSLQNVYKETGSQLTQAAMNVAAYATVLGKDVDDGDFQKQFMSWFELMVTIEEVLLDSYQNSIRHLEEERN